MIAVNGVERWNLWHQMRAQTVDLSGADLRGVNLVKVDFHEADLSAADFRDVNLNDANFRGANLHGARLKGASLVNANISGADLESADLSNAILTNANLAKANCTGANFTGANLDKANLSRTILIGAMLNDANLVGVKFGGSNLNGADLTKADLRDADLESADVTDTLFENTVVNSGTILRNLTAKQFDSLHVFGETDKPAETPAESDLGEPDEVIDVAIAPARRIVAAAAAILGNLNIPNDWDENYRDLFTEFRRTVEELEQALAKVENENVRLSEEIEAFGKVKDGRPVWRETWLTFVASAGGGLGAGLAVTGIPGFAAGSTAGFIAGVLHDTFSPADSCLI